MVSRQWMFQTHDWRSKNASQLINLKWKLDGYVTYRDNNRAKILGVFGGNDDVIIRDVLLANGLKHILLIISQLCDHGYKISLEPEQCLIATQNPVRQFL